MKKMFLILAFIASMLLAVSCVPRNPLRMVDESEYLSYSQTNCLLKTLADEHPELARMHSLGKSWENREIKAISIGFDQSDEKCTKPEIFVIGGQHANEWIGIEVVRSLAEKLITECKPGSEVETLLKKVNVWLIPIANPDGYEHARMEDRFWRKNRRFIGSGLFGVDMNRNWPYAWRLRDTKHPGEFLSKGSSDDPSTRWYGGFSDARDPSRPIEHEPEIVALLNLAKNPKRNFKMFLDYHSFSELVLFPAACSKEPTPDDKEYKDLAGRMVDTINASRKKHAKIRITTIAQNLTEIPFPKKYKARQCSLLYSKISTGGSIDTMYFVYGMWSLAIELPPNEGYFFGKREVLYVTGQGFRLDSRYIKPTCIEQWAGFLFAAKWLVEHPETKVLKKAVKETPHIPKK